MATTKDGTILVDSDSDSEGSPQKRPRHNRRGRGQGRRNAQTRRKANKKNIKIPVVIDSDDDLICVNDLTCERVPQINDISISEVLSTPSDTLQIKEIKNHASLSENCQAVVQEPRKAARRGLAKKNSSNPQTVSDSSSVPSQNTSVYSQAINDGFKKLIHGIGAESSCDSKEVPVIAETGGNMLPPNSRTDLERTPSKLAQSEDVEMDFEKTPDTSFKIPSPSPPPQLPMKRQAKSLNKKLTKALETLNKAKISLDKRTPRKKGSSQDNDVILVAEEAANKAIVVKVRYLTDVHRMHMRETEPFHCLVSKLSKKIDKPEHSLGLFLRDRSLEASETPLSIKLSVADILECHCVNVDKDSMNASDAIELVIQCKSSRSRTVVTANKRRPLADVIQKYASLMNKDADSFMFSFDGEDVDPHDTPNKLQMEDQDVIDAIHV